ncbi:uroplakin-3a isoform 1-T2 [Anomaloglossus baeobatrachus]|uniref:uroplakin-3a n=1 Tax=Anomaloglossus baeobatrachus TaxID=238106 RepID=UPI003F4FB22A
MGTWRCLLVLVGALWQSDVAHTVAPLLCRSSVCNINPTQNTVTLERPFCFYTKTTPDKVALYVIKDSAVNKVLALTNTIYTTNGGSSGPYVADIIANPDCAETPTTADVNKYVYRVGSNVNCFNSAYCNGPLANNTAYRFKYAFYDASNALLMESDWSAPITTKQGVASTNIDTWPGRRSGGMIVITSILSVLTFFVLAGLVAAIITYLMSPTKELEPTRHEGRSAHAVPQGLEGGTTVAEGTERYSTTVLDS